MHKDRWRGLAVAMITLGVVGLLACNADREMLYDAGRALMDASSDAAQAQDTCSSWEVREVNVLDSETATAMDPGWEPFSVTRNGAFLSIALRRCVM
ncbi:MAG: hypothetical protein AB7S26_05665 [Sandaracinaceae bacterium]